MYEVGDWWGAAEALYITAIPRFSTTQVCTEPYCLLLPFSSVQCMLHAACMRAVYQPPCIFHHRLMLGQGRVEPQDSMQAWLGCLLIGSCLALALGPSGPQI